MKEIKQLMKKESLTAAAMGTAAFAGTIYGIKKIQILKDQPELKKILIPALVILVGFKLFKKPSMRFAILAGAGIPLMRGAADYAKIKQASEFLPFEMGGDDEYFDDNQDDYEVPLDSPEGRAIAASFMDGEIETYSRELSGYMDDESGTSIENLARGVA